MPKAITCGPAGITRRLTAEQTPFGDSTAVAFTYTVLRLDFIAARRMSGSKLCAARRKAYLATGRPTKKTLRHTFLQTCGAYISA